MINRASLIMSSLDISLRDHISLALRPAAVEHLWGRQPSEFTFPEGKTHLDAYFEPYFRYYAQQCDLIGRHANGKYSSVETHREVLDITRLLQRPLSRHEVQKHMSDFLKPADKEQHQNSVNLAARVLLMIRIGTVPHECLGGRRRQIEWNEGNLLDFIRDSFAPPSSPSHGRVKLEKSFNALNLQRIAGIEIWWTDNLADHLRMMDDDKAVFVFHHASFLEYQKEKYVLPKKNLEGVNLLILIARFTPISSSRKRCGRSRFYFPNTTYQPRNGIRKKPQSRPTASTCILLGSGI